MIIINDALKKILVSQNYVSNDNIQKAEAWAKKNNRQIHEYLLNNELITKDLLGQAIAESLGLSYVDLNSVTPSKEIILQLPEEIAKKHHCILARSSDQEVLVTCYNPGTELKQDLQQIFPNKNVSLGFSMPEDIEALFINYRKPLVTRFASIVASKKRVAPEIVTEIFNDAIAIHASDIHFEPHQDEVIIRFRIDGVLHEAGRIPKELYENILNRIKVQAHLRTDEHFSAQDGSMQHVQGDQITAMRVSVLPVLDGEKVAIRLLSEYVKNYSLEHLGLTRDDHKKLLSVAHKPFGMVLVTGPTGSGKTTTLYALLNVLKHPELNITTIEDPVEYKIKTINQVQVDPKTNLTFAHGLKSILRQDPDIILVGEIRDHETAEIAVNASLTGHLLFSTFHANDAATAIPRLLDMGVEPFLVASTIQLILSQRLVRKICESCRYSYNLDLDYIIRMFPSLSNFFKNKTITLYQGKGCETCHNTGFRGRVGIFELIMVTKEIQDLIVKNPTSTQIWQLAKAQGGHTLFEDGIEKVKRGITSLDELMRVAPLD